jgi:myo-inositol-1(or 4)-monophosphatase
MIMVREAGGYVSDMDGNANPLETGNVVAGNDHLHAPLAAMLK